MMTKILLNLVLLITIISVSGEVVAQSNNALGIRKAKLQALSEKLKQRDAAERLQVLEFTKRTGIPARHEMPDGKVLELQRVSPDTGPVFYITNNAYAADTVSTLQVWPFGSAELDLNGNSMIIGEWDAGAIFLHPDFSGRVTQVDGVVLDPETNPCQDIPLPSLHSTHVAGTLIGTGELLDPDLGDEWIPRARGMAYTAQLDAWDWNCDTDEMTRAAIDGLLISNHSYGIAAGWLYFSDPPIIEAVVTKNWWWIGGAGIEDPNFGYYDDASRLWDTIAFDAPYYTIVKAAGNDRSDTGPSPGEEYTIIDQEGVILSNTAILPRNSDCTPGGYDCLPTISVAKNTLTIGAVNTILNGYNASFGPSQVQMTSFSGWGPTDDGRIKPDIVGNGELLLSTIWSGIDTPDYGYASGTSMAAPNVAGSLLLLQEHYQNIHGVSSFMRSATLKALVIHTADEAGSADGPDYAFGWGLLNTMTATQLISEDGGGNHQIIEGNLANSTVDTVTINLTETGSQITATLVWTDPAGTPVPLSLDASDSMLVNDLDLRIKKAPSSFQPWILNPANPSAAATKGDNFRDNVEQVKAVADRTGNYRVEISHKGTLLMLEGAGQNYSLIISVYPPSSAPPGETSLLIDEDFSGGLPAGWSVDTNLGGRDWSAYTPVAGNIYGLDNDTGGSGNFAMVLNNSCCYTVTSLITHSLDLSSAVTAFLRFNSSFFWTLLESINVDISTDGGISWSTSWSLSNNNHQSTQFVVDLSGEVAGHDSVMLRFRYDTWDVDGYYWQIDNIQLEVTGTTPPPANIPPIADFTNISNDLTASFTDTSSDADGTIVSWNWDFGDTKTSTAQNPSNIYTAAGTYTVTLTVTDDGGETHSSSQSVTVTLSNSAPTAGFTHVNSNLTVNFTDVSTDSDGTIDLWGWDFGDGNTSTAQNPSNIYTLAGTYTVTLTVTDDGGETHSSSQSVTVTLSNSAPTAGFTHASSNLTVNFTDISTDSDGTVDSWDWNFGDGNTSTVQNPSNTYTAAGTYTVALTVTDNDEASHSSSQSVMVTAPNIVPTANFTHTSNNLTANFTDASNDSDGTVVLWDWDFGDGKTSTVQSPSNTYTATGTYTVTLTVNDDEGMTDTMNHSVTVTDSLLSLTPNALFTYSCIGKECNFDATGSTDDGAIVSYEWVYGDGTSGNSSTASHSYTTTGDKTVTVTVMDNDGQTGATSGTISVKKGKKTSSGSFGSSGGSSSGDTGGSEKGRKKCTDGIDNDGDGLIDGADPDC